MMFAFTTVLVPIMCVDRDACISSTNSVVTTDLGAITSVVCHPHDLEEEEHPHPATKAQKKSPIDGSKLIALQTSTL